MEKRPPIIMHLLPDDTPVIKAWAVYQKLVEQERRNRKRAEDKGCYFEPVNFPAVIVRWNGCCCICGEPINIRKNGNKAEGLTLEHIISLGQGGRHTEDNIGPAHRRCNVEKAHKTDTPKAAKIKRVAGETGQYARRKKAKEAGKYRGIQSPGFNKSLKRKFDGTVVRKKEK